jgi:predicted N-acetyltransferase YhbS
MKLIFRPAEKKDCQGITDLTNELGYPSSFKKVYEILDLVLQHGDHQVFVAEFNDLIVGYIHLVCSYRIGSDPFVEIAALIVRKSARKQGVGKGLLEETQKWTTDKGYRNIRIRSNIIRAEAHKFFSQKGFVKMKTQDVFLKQI